MPQKFTNNAYGTLANGITSSDTTINLTSGHGARFPSLGTGDYFDATLIDSSNNLEIIRVTARATDQLTVTRGQDGTTARAYSTGDRIELRWTNSAAESARQESVRTIALSGTDTYTGTLSPTPTAYNTDQVYWFRFANTNTASNPTVNLSSLGAKTLKHASGATITARALPTGVSVPFVFDGTDFRMMATSPKTISTIDAAGGGTITLTTVQETSDILVFTGALTGTRTVEVSARVWQWTVFNNTTGNYTLTVKVSSGTGIAVPQGTTMALYCDGTNVLQGTPPTAGRTVVASATTPDIWTGTAYTIDYTGTATATGFATAPRAGEQRLLIAAGACAFTAGTNLIIAGVASGSTYTASAGDKILVTAITTTQFRCVVWKADGAAMAGGGAVSGVHERSSAFTITAADNGKLFECTGTFTVSFDALSTFPAAFSVWVVNKGTGAITLDPNGTELIVMPGGDSGGETTTTLPYTGSANGPYNVSGVLLHKTTDATPRWGVAATREVHGLARFTASGSWTAPAGVRTIWVTAQGGGGGGGGGGSGATGGGGGGSGAAAFLSQLSVVPGTSYTVTIGTGGSGGSTGNNGSSGGTTSLGSLLSLAGGDGGSHSAFGGGGGASGNDGHYAGTFGSSAYGGSGGSGIFGGAGRGGLNANGTAGDSNTGAGGGGGGDSYAGGSGGSGFMIIMW